ncbi:MAG: EAL domain-containing protein, partial [Clostridiales bacterium]|nr:EAL domain-containing protein [Clostridiales bacterium]
DEFIVVRKGKNIDEEIEKFSLSISRMLNETIKINRYSFNTEASIGISYYPQHATDAETLLKYADISMYEGKRAGGNKIRVFSPDMLENVYIAARLSNAIKNNELEVYYQPIYDVNNDKIVSAEALIRWISDEEIIPPNKFIPIAKKNGDILLIDEIVIRDAARFCKKIREKGESSFIVSVNISHALLKQSYFLSKIIKIVEEEGIAPDFLRFEITEDETIDDSEFTANVLKELKKLGFGISLDDFGVGYSSFNHIKTLPLDTLKIDRSLIFSIEEDKRTFSIIDTLINLSHSLGLDVICEGVEKKNEMELLKSIGCDKIQGYYISKVINKNDFIEFLLNFNKSHESDILNN